MPRLALASVETPLGVDTFATPIALRTGPQVLRRLGEVALLYRLVPGAFVIFHGRGKLLGLVRGPTPDQLLCQLDEVASFPTQVSRVELAATPGARRTLTLEDAEFDTIVAEATSGETPELAEPAPGLDVYVAIRDEVLRRWDGLCAVVGRRDPEMEVVAIRPRELGGPLHVDNFLPLVPIAAEAWKRGVISVGPGLDMLAVLDRLGPDLLSRMRRDGHLLVPEDPILWPSLEHLAFHRTHIFGR